ncbi:MAG: hypothetical protein DRN15_04980 [Thermoprotei archaeon]|nr:MAG: hypothetical protein DRN15_04980 [Thermoprotei archaeon]
MAKLWAIVIKEYRHLIRDPKTLLMIVFTPLIVTILFGLGYGGSPGRVPIALVLEDMSSLGYRLALKIRNVPPFDVAYTPRTRYEAMDLILDGEVFAVVIVPRDFEEEVMKGRGFIEVIVDEANPLIADLLASALDKIAYEIQLQVSEKARHPVVKVIIRTVYGPTVSKMESFMPLVLGVLLHLVPMSLISISICRERELGTFEQLVMTPISKWDIIVGKLIAYYTATMSDLVLTLAIAVVLFEVRVRSSLMDLIIFSSAFLFCSLSIGMLISVLARNQLQAQQASIFFFIPSLLFSGAFTPLKMLSPFARTMALTLPMPYFVNGIKALMIRGFSLLDVLYDLEAILIIAMLYFLSAIYMLKLKL